MKLFEHYMFIADKLLIDWSFQMVCDGRRSLQSHWKIGIKTNFSNCTLTFVVTEDCTVLSESILVILNKLFYWQVSLDQQVSKCKTADSAVYIFPLWHYHRETYRGCTLGKALVPPLPLEPPSESQLNYHSALYKHIITVKLNSKKYWENNSWMVFRIAINSFKKFSLVYKIINF